MQNQIGGVYMSFMKVPNVSVNAMLRKEVSNVYVGEPFYLYLEYNEGLLFLFTIAIVLVIYELKQ